MVTIASPMQQDKIIELLEGELNFTYKAKQGIKLQFEVEGDADVAAKRAKELIKAQPWGSVLYFQATAN
jgi:hypothetical protein